MKPIDKNKKLLGFSNEQIEEIRRELSAQIASEDLNHAWRLEALDLMLAIAQVDPATFRLFWVEPLLAAGLSREVAIACIADSYFQPN
jgi:hypothetical protein